MKPAPPVTSNLRMRHLLVGEPSFALPPQRPRNILPQSLWAGNSRAARVTAVHARTWEKAKMRTRTRFPPAPRIGTEEGEMPRSPQAVGNATVETGSARELFGV